MEIWLKVNYTITILFAVMLFLDIALKIDEDTYSYIGGLVAFSAIVSWTTYFTALLVWL